MAEKFLRFAVHNGEGCRAATWKCFARSNVGKSDVYLTCRELKGALKVSLHESNKCHLAYDGGFYKESVSSRTKGQKGRYITKWPMPSELSLGITIAYRIVTPWSSPTVPYDQKEFKKVVWVSNCVEGKATEIDLIITEKNFKVSGWPGKNTMQTQLIGKFVLDDGRVVWLVYWTVDMLDFGQLHGNPFYYKEKDRLDLINEGLRILLWGDEPDGSKTVYDCVMVNSGKIKNPAFYEYLVKLKKIRDSGIDVTLPRGKFFDLFRKKRGRNKSLYKGRV